MPKFRKVNNRRPTIVRADVSYYSKGIRRQLRISYPADAEQQITTPAKWQTLYQNRIYKLVVANATRDTTFTMQGEAVFFLIFRDGRRLRIYRDDFTSRNARQMNGSIRRFLFPDNPTKRVRQRVHKRARSKER